MTLTNKLILPVVVGYVLLASALYFAWEPQQLDRSRTQYLEQQQLVLKSLHILINDAVLQQDIDEINLRLSPDQTTLEKICDSFPSPLHLGQPPYGLLKENIFGVNAG